MPAREPGTRAQDRPFHVAGFLTPEDSQGRRQSVRGRDSTAPLAWAVRSTSRLKPASDTGRR